MAQYLGVDVVNSGKYFFVSYNFFQCIQKM